MLLDALVFSSLWVAAAAGALTAACSLAMGIPVAAPAVGLAFTGTLVIYNVDRLRDLDRDRATSPQRSAFVAKQAGRLTLLSCAAGLAAAGFALAAGPRAWIVLAPVLALGLFHRRLKHLTFAKSAYLTAAWIAVVAGVPAVIDPAATQIGWAAGIATCAIFANAVASNVRDLERAAARVDPRRVLDAARAVAAAGALIGAAAPAPARALLAVPLATLIALLPFRAGERYGLVVVDGALLLGALVTAALATP